MHFSWAEYRPANMSNDLHRIIVWKFLLLYDLSNPHFYTNSNSHKYNKNAVQDCFQSNKYNDSAAGILRLEVFTAENININIPYTSYCPWFTPRIFLLQTDSYILPIPISIPPIIKLFCYIPYYWYIPFIPNGWK